MWSASMRVQRCEGRGITLASKMTSELQRMVPVFLRAERKEAINSLGMSAFDGITFLPDNVFVPAMDDPGWG
jgi:hypothetical protein